MGKRTQEPGIVVPTAYEKELEKTKQVEGRCLSFVESSAAL